MIGREHLHCVCLHWLSPEQFVMGGGKVPDKNVIALQVTIDDLVGMKILEGACNLQRNTRRKRMGE